MSIQISQNKKLLFFFSLASFILLFMLTYSMVLPEILIIVLMSLLLFLLFVGGVIYGFMTKEKIYAAVLGFLFPFIFGIWAAKSTYPIDSYPQYPDLYFEKAAVFLPFILIGIFGAMAGWLASSENPNKNKRYLQYLVAMILLAVSFYIFLHPEFLRGLV